MLLTWDEAKSMGDNNLSVCQICKEPVWNFICPDCIAPAVKDFLPSSFDRKFEEFHSSFLFPFRNSELRIAKCLECRRPAEFTVCPYCYTNEIHAWLVKINQPLADRFIKIFSFGFDRCRLLPREPITGDVGGEEAGICDECGEYSESLVLLDGEWICRDCGITI
jgi:hypothetical protein